jgi:hypothetical protein
MGKINSATACDFIDSLGTIYDACNFIQDAGGCDKCPIKHVCLGETAVADFANFCTKNSLREFLDFADDVENYANEQDMNNYHDWLNAERDRELWAD